jgi:protein-tyrosine-phosphatase
MNILFLCHGNINRSSSAEIMARTLLPNAAVKSAGLKARPGSITSKKMRDTLNRRGYITQGIRSQQVTQELIDWADHVFYMDSGNEKRLLEQFGHMDKAVRLSEYVPGMTKIPDPTWGKDYIMHEQLVSLLETAFHNIQQAPLLSS